MQTKEMTWGCYKCEVFQGVHSPSACVQQARWIRTRVSSCNLDRLKSISASWRANRSSERKKPRTLWYEDSTCPLAMLSWRASLKSRLLTLAGSFKGGSGWASSRCNNFEPVTKYTLICAVSSGSSNQSGFAKLVGATGACVTATCTHSSLHGCRTFQDALHGSRTFQGALHGCRTFQDGHTCEQRPRTGLHESLEGMGRWKPWKTAKTTAHTTNVNKTKTTTACGVVAGHVVIKMLDFRSQPRFWPSKMLLLHKKESIFRGWDLI